MMHAYAESLALVPLLFATFQSAPEARALAAADPMPADKGIMCHLMNGRWNLGRTGPEHKPERQEIDPQFPETEHQLFQAGPAKLPGRVILSIACAASGR